MGTNGVGPLDPELEVLEDTADEDGVTVDGGATVLGASVLGASVLLELRVSKGWKECDEVDDSNSDVSGGLVVEGSADVDSEVAVVDRAMEEFVKAPVEVGV